jgi:hypothetical protein
VLTDNSVDSVDVLSERILNGELSTDGCIDCVDASVVVVFGICVAVLTNRSVEMDCDVTPYPPSPYRPSPYSNPTTVILPIGTCVTVLTDNSVDSVDVLSEKILNGEVTTDGCTDCVDAVVVVVSGICVVVVPN